MEIFARSLVTKTDAIGLIHPTFDNIPDILRGVGLRLVPVEEEQLHDEDLSAELLESVGCIFVTTPNNPTGRVMSEQRLRALADQCAKHGVVLALDTSFRGFDTDGPGRTIALAWRASDPRAPGLAALAAFFRAQAPAGTAACRDATIDAG